jgi:hypothetical protein
VPPERERRLLGREFAVEVCGGHAAVDEEVAAGDECPDGSHQERSERQDVIDPEGLDLNGVIYAVVGVVAGILLAGF